MWIDSLLQKDLVPDFILRAGIRNYYLSYCEAAFAMRNINVVQMLYTRPNNLSLTGGISHDAANQAIFC